MGKSLRKSINDKCKDCIYDDLDVGNWRQQVMACTIPSCPLYPVRPASKPRPQKTAKSCDIEATEGE